MMNRPGFMNPGLSFFFDLVMFSGGKMAYELW